MTTDPLVAEAEGLRGDVRRLNSTVKLLAIVVAVLATLVATLTALTAYLFVTRDDIAATLKSSTATLQSSGETLAILRGCLSPGPRTPTKDDPRTGNPCYDQLAATTAARVADNRLSIDCTAQWELGQLRMALGVPTDPLAPDCDGVVARIEALGRRS